MGFFDEVDYTELAPQKSAAKQTVAPLPLLPPEQQQHLGHQLVQACERSHDSSVRFTCDMNSSATAPSMIRWS